MLLGVCPSLSQAAWSPVKVAPLPIPEDFTPAATSFSHDELAALAHLRFRVR